MIVRDEAASIVKVLESVKPDIDHWTILDTGSTDGTQDLVRGVLGNVPGSLHEEPFVDFATTRNRALELAGQRCTFALMMSGDEVLVGGVALRTFLYDKAADPAGAYQVELALGQLRFNQSRVTRTDGGWRYVFPVHELLVPPTGEWAAPRDVVPGCHVLHERTKPETPEKYLQHAQLLRRYLKDHPKEPRCTFYLAQSLKDAGRYDDAIDVADQRIAIDAGNRAEVFAAHMVKAWSAARGGRRWSEVQGYLLAAYAHDPTRAEPLFEIGAHWRGLERHAVAYLYLSRAWRLPMASGLFVDAEVYRWRAAFLAGICAWYVGEFEEGEAATRKALAARPDDRQIRENLVHYTRRNRPPLVERVPADPQQWSVHLVPGPHAAAFEEVAETVSAELKALGLDSLRTFGDIGYAARRNIILGANALPAGARVPPGAIIYQLEQVFPGAQWLSPHYVDLLRRHEVWDYSETNIAELQRLFGIRASHVPIGYTQSLERIPIALARDIDVLFYGSMNDRRQRILDGLRARGLKVEAIFGVYGRDRDALIARSKLVLNMHFYEAKRFEMARVSYLLANGVLVVSEESEDAGDVCGMVFAPYGGIVDCCAGLLDADRGARDEVAEHGRRWMRLRPMRKWLAEATKEDTCTNQ